MLAIAAAVLIVIAQARTAQAAAEEATAARRKAAAMLEARAQADDAAEEALAELDRVRAQAAEQLAAYRTATEQAQTAARTARTELEEVRAAAAKAVTAAQEAAEAATHQATAERVAASAHADDLRRQTQRVETEARTQVKTDVEPEQATVVQQRTQAGPAAARPRGPSENRKPKMTPELVDKAQRMYDSGRFTVAEIAQSCAVSPTTIYRHIHTGGAAMH